MSVTGPRPRRSEEPEGRDRARRRPHVGARPARVFQQPQLHFGWAHDLVLHARILDVVVQIIGPDVLVHSVTLFARPPRSQAFVTYHQDGYYWNLSEPSLVSVWVALSTSTPDNGCVQVIPGSHVRRVPHAIVVGPDNMLTTGLSVEGELDERRAVPLVLRPGEMSLHHLNTIHGSLANRSDEPRVGMAIRYIAPSVRQATAHHVTILARGRNTHGVYKHLDRPPADDDDLGITAQEAFLHR